MDGAGSEVAGNANLLIGAFRAKEMRQSGDWRSRGGGGPTRAERVGVVRRKSEDLRTIDPHFPINEATASAVAVVAGSSLSRRSRIAWSNRLPAMLR